MTSKDKSAATKMKHNKSGRLKWAENDPQSLKRREKTDEKPINFKEISKRPLKSGTQVLLMVPNNTEQQGESDDDSGDWKQREGGTSIDVWWRKADQRRLILIPERVSMSVAPATVSGGCALTADLRPNKLKKN